MVIPTRNRPHMVVAAVRSALAQTHAPVEVIVVVDGPEDGAGPELSASVLSRVEDRCLRIVALPASVGGSEARNTGVRIATGEWIAFLDDDDLWLPGKLAVQLAFARGLEFNTLPVLSCPVLARGPDWQEVWPREPYRAGQPMAEYLFCRKGWRYGSALLQTSTLLAPRSLLLAVPFTRGLRKHQDWDWLLRAAAHPGVSVRSVGSAPLAIFHVEGERASVGRVRDWRFSLAWAGERREFVSDRAYAAFLATECAAQAGSAPLRERAALLRAVLQTRVPLGKNWLRLLAFLLVPQTLRRRGRTAIRKLRKRA